MHYSASFFTISLAFFAKITAYANMTEAEMVCNNENHLISFPELIAIFFIVVNIGSNPNHDRDAVISPSGTNINADAIKHPISAVHND